MCLSVQIETADRSVGEVCRTLGGHRRHFVWTEQVHWTTDETDWCCTSIVCILPAKCSGGREIRLFPQIGQQNIVCVKQLIVPFFDFDVFISVATKFIEFSFPAEIVLNFWSMHSACHRNFTCCKFCVHLSKMQWIHLSNCGLCLRLNWIDTHSMPWNPLNGARVLVSRWQGSCICWIISIKCAPQRTKTAGFSPNRSNPSNSMIEWPSRVR